jgi:hypothetical protein
MLNAGLKFEIIKLKSNNNIIKIFSILLLIILVFIFILTYNFGPKYFSAVNYLKVNNAVDYFYNKLFLLNAMALSFFIVFSAYIIYQIENNSHVDSHLSNFTIKQSTLLNDKLKLHFAITLLWISCLTLVVFLAFILVYQIFPIYAKFSKESMFITFLKHNSLFIIKSINCCLIVRILNSILKKNSLIYIIYLTIFLNNFLISGNFLNFIYLSQSNYSSTLLVALFTSAILIIILFYENRIFKTKV